LRVPKAMVRLSTEASASGIASPVPASQATCRCPRWRPTCIIGRLGSHTSTRRSDAAIWAYGAMVFTLLAKSCIAIEFGQVRDRTTAATGGTAPRDAGVISA
jgi:hypothetical protein